MSEEKKSDGTDYNDLDFPVYAEYSKAYDTLLESFGPHQDLPRAALELAMKKVSFFAEVECLRNAGGDLNKMIKNAEEGQEEDDTTDSTT